MDTKPYLVVDTAPPRVAGRRDAKPGDVLRLTDAEALYERDLGHIEPVTVEELARLADLADQERAALPPLLPAPAGEGDTVLLADHDEG